MHVFRLPKNKLSDHVDKKEESSLPSDRKGGLLLDDGGAMCNRMGERAPISAPKQHQHQHPQHLPSSIQNDIYPVDINY